MATFDAARVACQAKIMDLVSVEKEEEGICIQMEIMRKGEKHSL